MSGFRCSACRRAVGPILAEDALTPMLIICPQTGRAATTERIDNTWEAVGALNLTRDG